MSSPKVEKGADIFVSVVVPVYNEPTGLQKCLDMATMQDYPRNSYEVIVVDNGSTDNTAEVARGYESVTLVSETKWTASPYSARNRGVEQSQGDVIAFVDANCYPSKSWLTEGITALHAEQADLVGGNVKFYFSDRLTVAQLLDALTNIRMRESVLGRGVAKTANLFVRRTVFDAMGLFPEGIRSGGDVRWTHQAVQQGYKLVFSEQALVWKAARSFNALAHKQWRVAKSQPAIWKSQGKDMHLWRVAVQMITPPSHKKLLRAAQARGEPYVSYYGRIWMLHYVLNALMRLGNLYAMIRMRTAARAIEPTSKALDNH